MVKIKNIKGALVEKRPENFTDPNFQQRVSYEGIGANKVIDQQGEIDISLSREKLANIISNAYRPYAGTEIFNNYEIADAIIAAEKDLLEVKP